MAQSKLIPDFGPLCGMKVLCSGSLIAMPFAASMLAEFGAEVIEIERPGMGDAYRQFPPVYDDGKQMVSAAWMQDARNRLSMTMELNLKYPEVKETFYDLIRWADVYMENLVWLEKLGIRDEELLAINPRLVICHVSGYGNARFGGVPKICNRASYDIIGQAFSGYMNWNGTPANPLVVMPAHNDYVSAMFALFGVMAAYVHAVKTGRGQVVDVSQFESQARFMQDAFTRTTMGVGRVERAEKVEYQYQPWGVMPSKDGGLVAVGVVGEAVFGRFMKATGLDSGKYQYGVVSPGVEKVYSPIGRAFNREVEDWFAAHTTEEIVSVMANNRIPCSKVNTVEDCLENEHFKSRGDFITYRDQTLDKDVTAFGVFPKFSETPGQVWRGAPGMGQDTYDILHSLLGYSRERIEKMQAEGVI